MKGMIESMFDNFKKMVFGIHSPSLEMHSQFRSLPHYAIENGDILSQCGCEDIQLKMAADILKREYDRVVNGLVSEGLQQSRWREIGSKNDLPDPKIYVFVIVRDGVSEPWVVNISKNNLKMYENGITFDLKNGKRVTHWYPIPVFVSD